MPPSRPFDTQQALLVPPGSHVSLWGFSLTTLHPQLLWKLSAISVLRSLVPSPHPSHETA